MSTKNTEPYISKYLHAQGSKYGLPISGTFELTARCNFNCHMCYVHLTQEQVDASGKELTAGQWLKIAEAARDKGMVFALLTGGEPLIRKDFFEIYKGMQDMGLVLSVNSNGSMLKGAIAERFLEAPPARFNISLYGGSNETYRKMCGIPVYDQVKDNIRNLRRAGVDVSLNLPITEFNRNDLEQIYADAVELDVNVRSTSYMYPSVRVNGEQFGCGNRLSATDSAECSVKWDTIRFTEEEFLARAENMRNRIVEWEGCPVEEGEGVTCRAGSSSFWMTWDGRMLPCGMLQHPAAYPLEIGFDAAWEQIRKQTREIRTPAKCTGCEYRDLCGACTAVYYTETGRFDAVPEYVCQRAKEIVRVTQRVYEEKIGK